MNSSILVSGLVIVGVGAMAVLFNPFGSSDTSPNPTGTYQVSADAKQISTPSPVSASSDPEPFVWENKKETVASTGILKDLNSQSTAKKVAKAEKSSRALGSQRSKASNASKDSTQKLQTVSKTGSNFGDQAASTADADLNSFFGKSKPAAKVAKAPARKPATKVIKAPARKPAAKIAKAPKTKPNHSKGKSEPVRVASKPVLDSAKKGVSRPTREVKSSFDKNEMFSFAPRGEDGIGDAPMLAPVKSHDFDMPKLKPVNENKTESSSQGFAGSFETVLANPVAASPTVKEFNIKNPLQTRLTVTFLANGKKVSLKPGQHFLLRHSEDVQVKFSRGGSFGFSERSLSEGDYQFSVTRKDGWKLAQ